MSVVGVKKMPQTDQANKFDISTLVGGLFYTLILHQVLPVVLSVRSSQFLMHTHSDEVANSCILLGHRAGDRL